MPQGAAPKIQIGLERQTINFGASGVENLKRINIKQCLFPLCCKYIRASRLTGGLISNYLWPRLFEKVSENELFERRRRKISVSTAYVSPRSNQFQSPAQPCAPVLSANVRRTI